MRLNRKLMWLAMLAVAVLCTSGCSGIHQSGTVSPASFFLPGILKVDPAPKGDPLLLPETETVLASAK